jgi:uncharacterized LabA/DUF88 family protein
MPSDALKHFFDAERTAMFIDGASLYTASRNLGFDVDYSLLIDMFRDRTDLVHACYYSAILETDEYSPLKPLTDWLAYNGYIVKTKPAREYTDAGGRRRVKGNIDIELAVDMLDLAPHIRHVVLVSGDTEFRALIESVQRKGVKVTVVSTVQSSPPLAADDLRRQANFFIDLADIKELIRREAPPTRR